MCHLQIPQHVEDDPDDYEDEEDAPSEDFDEDEEEDIGFHEGMHACHVLACSCSLYAVA